MRAFVAFVVLLAAAAVAEAGEADSAGDACVQQLSAASEQCSAALNGANKVAYARLDRLFGTRGNSAFRLDAGRFFRMSVSFTQSSVSVPEPCCRAAAEVLSQRFQDECACRGEVVQHTKWIDKELMDYYRDFLTASCGLGERSKEWKTCGLTSDGFVAKAQEQAFGIPEWVDKLVTAGKTAVTTAAGAAGAAAGAATGVATGVAANAAGAAWRVGSSIPQPFGRRLQGDQCSANNAAGDKVAQNTAGAPFYFLCPPSKGHCSGSECVHGRTQAVSRGEWATCADLGGCSSGSGCFPAAATVQLEGGQSKRMDQLAVGDRVLALASDGALKYEDVYFFGHRDAASDAAFVRLGLDGGAELLLTPDHFVPVLRAGSEAAARAPLAAEALAGARMTYARAVTAGDVLAVADGAGGLRAASVISSEAVRARGLFNPYTLGGTIVVDGVLASAHSGWLIDGAAAALGASHALPAVFQALFAPLRALYAAAGPEFMSRFGDALAVAALRLEAGALGLAAGPAAAAAAPAAAAAATAVAVAAGAGAALKRRGAAARI
ncbi:hypothetical protein Rsub_01358 [Raphidocelis subcapitata]|uniref:Hint domain-containing protein n=1 Tax=Raphidocelis subcapitata TaxID=307507 RepID=A0A2V0NNQ2_9CHLO|nr:hypothetical protein Rsub_01358 [Raphidocelis subcapitata]|eukprot:GBF88859.1 hypothetical protein Rsub_01358 [Raphidocelis subcapitata]